MKTPLYIMTSMVIVILVCELTACSIAGGRTAIPFTGNLESSNFPLNTAVAETSPSDSTIWNVYVWSKEATQANPYPYLLFNLSKTSVAKTYEIYTLLGTADSGLPRIQVFGRKSYGYFINLIQGKLEIRSIDTANNKIEATFINAATGNNSSSFNGDFTVTIK